MNNRGDNKETAGATVLAVILVVAFAIELAQAFFPIFVMLSIFLSITFVLSLFYFEDFSLYIGIGLLITLLGAGLCYGIGYSFGESEVGTLITDTADAVEVATDTLDEAERDANVAVIDALQDINDGVAEDYEEGPIDPG